MFQVLRGGAAVVLSAFMLAGCGTKEPELNPSPPRLRLITTDQYFNTLTHVFGPSVDLDTKFAPPRRVNGLLASGTAVAGVTAAQLEQFQRAASTVANLVVDADRRNYLVPCAPEAEDKADEACATQYISQVGRLLHRRSLSTDEVAGYVREANAAAERLEDFYAGLAMVTEAMLISPEVLFIVERSEADPKNSAAQRLDAYSLASRLSFFLWNASPDDELLRAAESGDLHSSKGLRKVVDMMLTSPRLEDGMRAFFDDMFAFDIFDSLSKDPTVYPFFTGATSADAREQTLRTVIDHLIHKNLDYRDLLTTRSTFMSPALAPLYQIPASQGWTAYEFPENSPRRGLLTQVSFLATHSHPGRSSPTLRGKAMRELMLCQTVPPPPPNVDFSALENPESEYKTQRDRVAVHLQDPACAGCHKITDPAGLALENFDGAGRFRLTEHDTAIDTSGNLDGIAFENVVQMAEALRENPGVPTCLVNRMFSYGTGTPLAAKERPFLEYLTAEFADDGYRVPDLLRTIVMSNAFKQVSAVTPAPMPREDEAATPTQQTTQSNAVHSEKIALNQH